MTDEEIDVGAVVVDGHDDDPDEAVVVNSPPVEAAEWELAGGVDLLEYGENDQYDEDSGVAIVVFADLLLDEYPDYEGEEPLALSELSDEYVRWFAFPAPRLEYVRDVTEEPEPSETLLTIAERLEEKDLPAEIDPVEGAVTTEYLGETYVIDEDGSVSGGSMSDRLEGVVGGVTVE